MVKRAKWIWYPGDREIYLSNNMLLRRDYRGITEHPFWRIDNVYPCVFYYKEVSLSKREKIHIKTKAVITVLIDELQPVKLIDNNSCILPAGNYILTVAAVRLDGGLPAVVIESETVFTDESWTVSLDKYRGEKIPVGFSDDILYDDDPDEMKFELNEIFPVEIPFENKRIFDFGRDVFGYLRIKGKHIRGKYFICYGESLEEASSSLYCEVYDNVDVDSDDIFILTHSRGFRFVSVTSDIKDYEISLNSELLPTTACGSFVCSEELMNRIEEVSLYTLSLNMRETFIDGIKRDRWCWGGDVYHAILFNMYSYFDKEICRRSLWATIGKIPDTHYINHIMDYSYLWFIALYEYYAYTADIDFLKTIFNRAFDHLNFCLKQLNKDGFVEGDRYRDWVFIEWAEFPKEGVLSAEQILFYKAICCMAELAESLHRNDIFEKLKAFGAEYREKIVSVFYDKEKHLFYNNAIENEHTDSITRYANVFAVMFDFFNEDESRKIVEAMRGSKHICEIKTPYAKFYEIVMLCKMGYKKDAYKNVKDYWGGMINEGATTFWESYDPKEIGNNRYMMYGRPFGKSLCHAWGAGPIYINGRYYLGVKPDKAGYEEYSITPDLADYDRIEGEVITPTGKIHIFMDRDEVNIMPNTEGKGHLYLDKKYFKDQSKISDDADFYVIDLIKDKETTIRFSEK